MLGPDAHAGQALYHCAASPANKGVFDFIIMQETVHVTQVHLSTETVKVICIQIDIVTELT